MNKHTCEVYWGKWYKGWDKYCAYCEEHYVALSSNGKYCSPECKRAANKKRPRGEIDIVHDTVFYQACKDAIERE